MNRPNGAAMQDRLLMLSYMPMRFSVSDFADVHNMTYEKAAWTIRSMVDCDLLIKSGTRMARVYIQR